KDLLPRDLKERLEGAIKDPSKLSPQQLEELQNWAKNNAAKLNPETSGSKNDDKTDNPTPERSSKRVPSEERPQGKAEQVSRGAIGPTLPDLNLSKNGGDYAGRLMNWINSSPAMRQAFRNLSRHLGEDDPRWRELSARFESVKDW